MKKQTIKLNESQLRQMVREALNELDWKTYANAARKRAERDKRGGGRNEKVRQLDKAASDALNKKFNMQNHRAQISTEYDDYHGYGQTGRYPSLGDVADYTDTFYSDFKNPDNSFERIGYPGERSKEMSDYFKGNYDYTPDKGWHLKESKLNKIIKESIKKVLNERSLDDTEHTNLYGYDDTEDYSDEDLVKVAEPGDYTSAFIDYLKELIGADAENLTLNSFIKDMRSGKIRYCEKNDGIYYVNDWAGA